MSIRIKSIKDTELTILSGIKQRDKIEKTMLNEIVKNYQALIKKLYDSRGKNDELRQSLLSNFSSKNDPDISSAEKMQRLNEELKDAYK